MSIVADQMPMADAALNARTIAGEEGENWVQRHLTESQLRRSYQMQNLISGWWGGSIQGADRSPSMYPDNNMPFVALTVQPLEHDGEAIDVEWIKPSSNYM